MIRSVPKPLRTKRDRVANPRKVSMEMNPLEDTEQQVVVDWLRAHKILFHHSPNGGYRHPVTAMRMKRQGVSPGFPDLIVLDRPDVCADGKLFVGACVEMKRRAGGTVSKEQKEWLSALEERGWACKVAKGCDDAIQFLQECGYGK